MKTSVIILTLLLFGYVLPAQNIKPCCNWLTGYIAVEPKVSDGTPINKYLAEKLASDTSLKGMISCMAGLRIYANCNGGFSYVEQEYANKPALTTQSIALRQKIETIINGINHFSPGTIDGKPQDFIFKLVVRVKRNGKPMAEILY